jgi:hypothetical protein
MTGKTRFVSIFSILLALMLIAPVGDVGITNVSAGDYCDWVRFVADVTIPDGLPVDPGIALKKTWRLKNIGTCTWTRSYKLAFVSGEQMGGVSAVNLPKDVAPGQTIDLTIGLTAPMAPGRYIGYWQLQNPAGGFFGMGQTASSSFFVEIEVVSKAPPVFDFVANAPAANWRTEVRGKVTFPGVYGDPFGFVLPVDQPILENGIPSTAKGLLMAPPFEYNEHIYGVFPPYEVKRGDRFQSLVGCEYGSRECEVTFVLQYQVDGSPTRSFWNTWKNYKNTFSRVNLNLSPLAGKKVSFILLIRPNGATLGDRAVWANPVIVNSNEPGPAIPTVTPPAVTPTPTMITMLTPNTGCDRAAFVSDVTVPDGTVFAPGQAFTKTWKLRNNGKCTWTTDYTLLFYTGDQMGGASPVNLPSAVGPGQTIDLSVNLTAPNGAGNYRGYWLLRNPSGGSFGIGPLANKPFWLSINVSGSPTPSSASGYDFVARACEAQWTSGIGGLPCPNNSDMNGTIMVVNNPLLENNTVDSRSALLTVPQNVYNGYIQGAFPPFAVQNGDHFKSIVNCEYLQRNCYVVFRLDYQIDNGPVQNLWAFGERYEGLYYQADIDLSPLAGQNVKFILRTNANGSPVGDRAVWVAPAIVRSGGSVIPVPTVTLTVPSPVTPFPTSMITSTAAVSTPAVPAVTTETATPIPTPTATLTPPVNPGQLTYNNQKYGFQFMYPANGVITTSQDNFAHLNLPFVGGTNLVEKYLEVTVFENAATCTSPLTNGYAPGSFESQQVTGNTGIQFTRESGQGGAAGQIYDWIAYSTPKGTTCISMNFVLHSTNPFNFPVPPVYNKDLESAIFLDVISTFGWTTP